MHELWAAYAAAFILGAAHALEVDHMVAMTAFVGGRPRPGLAALFGIRWGLGHATAVLAAGALLAWSGLRVPAAAEAWAELGVGIMLMAVGLWAGRNARRLHVHEPVAHGGPEHAHIHLHAHDPVRHPYGHRHVDPDRRHRHLSTLVGAAHGLAGTAPAVALLPVTLIDEMGAAIGYLAAFGIGTTAAMGIYAVVAALAVRRAARSLRAARMAALLTAAASVVVGGYWAARAAADLVAG